MRLPAPSTSPSPSSPPSSSPAAAQLFFVQSAVGAQFGCCIVACFLWPAAHSSGHDFGFSAMCTDSPFALALFCIPCATPHRQLTIASPRATGPDLGQVALEISKINSHHLNHRQARQELRWQRGRLRWSKSGQAVEILLPLWNPFSANRQRVKLVSWLCFVLEMVAWDSLQCLYSKHRARVGSICFI